jgi:hypothetical protein
MFTLLGKLLMKQLVFACMLAHLVQHVAAHDCCIGMLPQVTPACFLPRVAAAAGCRGMNRAGVKTSLGSSGRPHVTLQN